MGRMHDMPYCIGMRYAAQSFGGGYWCGFMRRHGREIVSKRGAKYALNRAEWYASPLTKIVVHQVGKDIMDIVKLSNQKSYDHNTEKVGKGRNDDTMRIESPNTVFTKKG